MRTALILAALAAAAFGTCLTGEFHLDDYALFSDPSITAPRGWLEVWSAAQTRPVTWLTFWANYQVAGESPAGYHAVSLILHAANTVLAWLALRRLLPVTPAWMAAAAFAIHPLQAEAVCYVFARATLLMTLFSLLSLRAWFAGKHWQAAAWFVPALLAKEECVALPLVLLALHFSISRNRAELRPIAVMLACAAAAGLRVAWAASITPGSGAAAQAVYTSSEYLFTQGAVLSRYLRLFLAPWGFSIDPEIDPRFAAPGWVIVAALAGAACFRFSRAREGFWLISGLMLLFPSSSVFPASDLSADRRMYLPMVAFGAAAGLLFARWRPQLYAVLCTIWLILSLNRAQIWRTERTLWTEAVERAPGKVRPKIQLSRSVEPARAIRVLEQAKLLEPGDALVATELGRAYLQNGQRENALAEFGRALALAPDNAQALSNRGVALAVLGQNAAARQDFERALAIEPCLFEARLNLKRLGAETKAPARCRFTPGQAAALEKP